MSKRVSSRAPPASPSSEQWAESPAQRRSSRLRASEAGPEPAGPAERETPRRPAARAPPGNLEGEDDDVDGFVAEEREEERKSSPPRESWSSLPTPRRSPSQRSSQRPSGARPRETPASSSSSSASSASSFASSACRRKPLWERFVSLAGLLSFAGMVLFVLHNFGLLPALLPGAELPEVSCVRTLESHALANLVERGVWVPEMLHVRGASSFGAGLLAHTEPPQPQSRPFCASALVPDRLQEPFARGLVDRLFGLQRSPYRKLLHDNCVVMLDAPFVLGGGAQDPLAYRELQEGALVVVARAERLRPETLWSLCAEEGASARHRRLSGAGAVLLLFSDAADRDEGSHEPLRLVEPTVRAALEQRYPQNFAAAKSASAPTSRAVPLDQVLDWDALWTRIGNARMFVSFH